jgi:inner membrane protein
MDNLTHTLAGAALGEAGLKRLSGLGMAALMIGANLPDIDAIAMPLGVGLPLRRGWTHGPLAMLVLPLLLAGALIALDRWQARRGTRPAGRGEIRAGPLLLLCYIGVLSHPALDWLNTYGIRLLMPFSERWFYGDSIFIIDPWIWLALGIGVWLARRRGRRSAAPRPGSARVALTAVTLYVALMIVGSRSAHDHAVRHITAEEGAPPARVMAGPVPLDPTRRELIFDLGDRYRFGELAWRPRAELRMEEESIPIRADHPAVTLARTHPDAARFLVWSRFPFWEVRRGEASDQVRLGDARFARRPGEWFNVTVEVPREVAR